MIKKYLSASPLFSTKIVHSIYILAVVPSLSGSFGVAVPGVFLGLLSIMSFFYTIKYVSILKLLRHEYFLSFLIGWLLITNMLNEYSYQGFIFIVSEYWILPSSISISFMLSRILDIKKIITPFYVGFAFNIAANVFLFFSKNYFYDLTIDPVDHFFGLNGLRGPVVSVDPVLTYSWSVGGKFLQAWISGLTFCILLGSLFIRNLSLPIKAIIAGVIVLDLGLLAFFVDSRSGVIGAIAVLSLFSFTIFPTLPHRARLQLSLLLFLCVVLFLIVNDRVFVLFTELSEFVLERRGADTSFGMRLLAWSNIFSMDLRELAVGYGSGNWWEVMRGWYARRTIWPEMVQWRDFHSAYIWLIVQSGILGALIYFAWVCNFIFCKYPVNSGKSEYLYLTLLGFYIVAFVGFLGIFNSVFTSIRESYISGIALIAYSSIYRILRDLKTERY